MSSVTLFLDSPIFFHYKPLADIPWREHFKAEAVRLVVCMPVINEIDTKTRDQRLGDRAARAMKEIEEGEGREVRTGVTLHVMNHIPRREDYPEGMSMDHQDDRVIRCAQVYLGRESDHAPVVMISADLGMRLRCRGFGLRAEKPLDSWKLPNTTDELTKKLKKAEAELAAERARKPNLELDVSPKGSRADQEGMPRLTESDLYRVVEVAEAVGRKRQEHPKIGDPENPFDFEAVLRFPALASRERLRAHNASLDEYYKSCERHFQAMNRWVESRGRFYDFDLRVDNLGTAQATNVQIQLAFPSFVELLDGKVRSDPRDPVPLLLPPPREPDLWEEIVPAMSSFRTGGDSRPSPAADSVAVRVRNEEGVITCALDKLLHNDHRQLGTFHFWFPQGRTPGPIEISYTLLMAELADKVEGTIPVAVER